MDAKNLSELVKCGRDQSDTWKTLWFKHCDDTKVNRDPGQHTMQSMLEFVSQVRPDFEDQAWFRDGRDKLGVLGKLPGLRGTASAEEEEAPPLSMAEAAVQAAAAAVATCSSAPKPKVVKQTDEAPGIMDEDAAQRAYWMHQVGGAGIDENDPDALQKAYWIGRANGMPASSMPPLPDGDASMEEAQRALWMQQMAAMQQSMGTGQDMASNAMQAGSDATSVEGAVSLEQIMAQQQIVQQAEEAAREAAAKFKGHIGLLARYDDKKGYGFIQCEETKLIYTRDIFLHRFQFRDLEVGDTVSFEVEINDKQLPQARSVRKLKELTKQKQLILKMQQHYTGAVTPAPVPRSKENLSTDQLHSAFNQYQATIKEYHGTLAKFDGAKGYGFLECAETFALFGRHVFLHKSQYPEGLKQTEYVSFHVELNEKGWPQARDVAKEDEYTRKKKMQEQKKLDSQEDAASMQRQGDAEQLLAMQMQIAATLGTAEFTDWTGGGTSAAGVSVPNFGDFGPLPSFGGAPNVFGGAPFSTGLDLSMEGAPPGLGGGAPAPDWAEQAKNWAEAAKTNQNNWGASASQGPGDWASGQGAGDDRGDGMDLDRGAGGGADGGGGLGGCQPMLQLPQMSDMLQIPLAQMALSAPPVMTPPPMAAPEDPSFKVPLAFRAKPAELPAPVQDEPPPAVNVPLAFLSGAARAAAVKAKEEAAKEAEAKEAEEQEKVDAALGAAATAVLLGKQATEDAEMAAPPLPPDPNQPTGAFTSFSLATDEKKAGRKPNDLAEEEAAKGLEGLDPSKPSAPTISQAALYAEQKAAQIRSKLANHVPEERRRSSGEEGNVYDAFRGDAAGKEDLPPRPSRPLPPPGASRRQASRSRSRERRRDRDGSGERERRDRKEDGRRAEKRRRSRSRSKSRQQNRGRAGGSASLSPRTVARQMRDGIIKPRRVGDGNEKMKEKRDLHRKAWDDDGNGTNWAAAYAGNGLVASLGTPRAAPPPGFVPPQDAMPTSAPDVPDWLQDMFSGGQQQQATPMAIESGEVPPPVSSTGLTVWAPKGAPYREVRIPQQFVARVIGKGGEVINAIRQASGAELKVRQETKEFGYSIIILTGTEEQVSKAQLMIEQKIGGPGGGMDVREVELPPEHVSAIIGPKGATVTDVRQRAGGLQIEIRAPNTASALGMYKAILGPGRPEQVALAERLIIEKIAELEKEVALRDSALAAQGARSQGTHGQSPVPCRFFNEGRCAKGLACPFAHVAPGTEGAPTTSAPIPLEKKMRVLCRFFQNGVCSRGQSCLFCHGAEELAACESAAKMRRGKGDGGWQDGGWQEGWQQQQQEQQQGQQWPGLGSQDQLQQQGSMHAASLNKAAMEATMMQEAPRVPRAHLPAAFVPHGHAKGGPKGSGAMAPPPVAPAPVVGGVGSFV